MAMARKRARMPQDAQRCVDVQSTCSLFRRARIDPRAFKGHAEIGLFYGNFVKI